MIKLELELKDLKQTIQTMKDSIFRRTLFEVCKTCFEKFFDVTELEKSNVSKEY